MSAIQKLPILDDLAEKLKDKKKVMLEIPLHTKDVDFSLENKECITLVLSGEGVIIRNGVNASQIEFNDESTPFIICGEARIYPDEDVEISYKEIPTKILDDEEILIISRLCT